MGTYSALKQAFRCFFLTLMVTTFFSSTSSWADNRFVGVKRGRVFFKAQRKGTIKIGYHRIYKYKSYVYIHDPLGNLLEKYSFSKDSGEELLKIKKKGIYETVLAPNYHYELAFPYKQAVFKPEKSFPSLRITESERKHFYFYVPPSTSDFTLFATNQEELSGRAVLIKLYSPERKLVETFDFPDFDQDKLIEMLNIPEKKLKYYLENPGAASSDEFKIFTLQQKVSDPVEGFWRVSVYKKDPRYCDVGFWLEGVPNYFSTSPRRWFIPDYLPVTTKVTMDTDHVLGNTAAVGVVWEWPSFQEEAKKFYMDMGMEGDKHFFDLPGEQSDSGYNFERSDFRMQPLKDSELNLKSLASLCANSGSTLEFFDDMERFFDFGQIIVERYLSELALDSDRIYWQFLNEPNHRISKDAYIDSYGIFADRIKKSIPDIQLGGPGLGNARGEEDIINWEWISDLLKYHADKVDFISWNLYGVDLLEDTWRYKEAIEKTDELIKEYSNGNLKSIIIGGTNLKGGIVLQLEKQDSFYSALWWASVLNNSIGTGKLKLILYFYLVDQGARRKGLLFSDLNQKPVAYAMMFYNAFLLDKVIKSYSDYHGLETLATRNSDNTRYCLFLLNKTKRKITVNNFHLLFSEATIRNAGLKIYRLNKSDSDITKVMEFKFSFNSDYLNFQYNLLPESIYLFDLEFE